MSLSDRAWLREQGFTVGERGRFSAEMLDALKSRNSETEHEDRVAEVEAAGLDPVVIRTPVRDARELFGFDAEGHKIGFVICSKCREHMIWCECKSGVHAPSSVKTSPDPLVVIG